MERKSIKLNNTTKNGYAISIIEAADAPKLLMPEKIKKFANVAKSAEIRINDKVVFPEPNKDFKELLLKNIKGNVINVAKNEVPNKRIIGEMPERIFWSIA